MPFELRRRLPVRPLLAGAASVALFGACAACSTMIRMPDESYAGPQPPLTRHERQVQGRLVEDVGALAATIGERNTVHPDAYGKSAAWIEERLSGLGSSVARQSFRAGSVEVSNLIVELAGTGRRNGVLQRSPREPALPLAPRPRRPVHRELPGVRRQLPGQRAHQHPFTTPGPERPL